MKRTLGLLALFFLAVPQCTMGATLPPSYRVLPSTALDVELAPYGAPEDLGAFVNAGILGIRFDPPFRPPYEITSVSFPSFTASGLPAVFESVSLCELDRITGLVKLSTPILRIAPFVGSSDGWNQIPVAATVSDSGQIFFICIAFPGSTSADERPLLGWDARVSELGDFGSSYDIIPPGRAFQRLSGNFVAKMRFKLSLQDSQVPLRPQNFGANRVGAGIEFSFLPGDAGSRFDRTDLLFRSQVGPWERIASATKRTDRVVINSSVWDSLGAGYWCAQSVDRDDSRSAVSNIAWVPSRTALSWGDDHAQPNGVPSESSPITPCLATCTSVDADLFTAGDRDFWSFETEPGDKIEAVLIPPPQDGLNDMRPVLALYDWRERQVAADSGSGHLTYTTPARRGHGKDGMHSFFLLVTDASSPGSPAPRHLVPSGYNIRVELDRTSNSIELSQLPIALRARAMGAKGVAFEFATPTKSEARLRIYDVRGRLLRTIIGVPLQVKAGRALRWDMRDDSGFQVPAGVYFARLEVGEIQAARKFVLVR